MSGRGQGSVCAHACAHALPRVHAHTLIERRVSVQSERRVYSLAMKEIKERFWKKYLLSKTMKNSKNNRKTHTW